MRSVEAGKTKNQQPTHKRNSTDWFSPVYVCVCVWAQSLMLAEQQQRTEARAGKAATQLADSSSCCVAAEARSNETETETFLRRRVQRWVAAQSLAALAMRCATPLFLARTHTGSSLTPSAQSQLCFSGDSSILTLKVQLRSGHPCCAGARAQLLDLSRLLFL